MVGLTSDNIHIPFLLGLGFRVSCGEGDIGDGAPSGASGCTGTTWGISLGASFTPRPRLPRSRVPTETGSGGSMQRRRTTTE